MYSVGIIGHSIEYVDDHEKLKREIFNVVDLIKFQYGNDLIINASGNVGAGHWTMKSCIDLSVKYQIFLPGPVENCGEYWYEFQQKDLVKYYNSAWASTVCSPKSNIADCYKMLASNSNFLIAFWIGKKTGSLFECITHCFQSNKMVINAFTLKMITRRDLF